MALEKLDYNYTVNDGQLTVSVTDKDGKTTTKTGDEAKSLFIENGYSETEADNIVNNLLNTGSYDSNTDGILSDSEITDALNEARDAAGSTPSGGSGGVNGGSNGDGTDGTTISGENENSVDGSQPGAGQYRGMTNVELSSSMDETQKNFDTSKADVETAKAGINEAKTGFANVEAEQAEKLQEARTELENKNTDYEEIKEKYGEEIADALQSVKDKQTEVDDAQNNVNTLTTDVADATTAVSEATAVVAEKNAALTAAEAALDAAPMFIQTGTNEDGSPILQPNPEIPALQAAVAEAKAALEQAQQDLETKKEELAKKEQELQEAQELLDTKITERDECQTKYDETVEQSEFAKDEALAEITEAMKGLNTAQDTRKEKLQEAREVVTEASKNLKEVNENFNNSQDALNQIQREVNNRKAKGIWDTTSDKTVEELEAEKEEEKKAEEEEKAEEDKKAEEEEKAEDKAEDKEAKEEKEEEQPKEIPADKKVIGSDVTYAMVKEELELADKNNVNLKDYVYAKGADNIYHLYNKETGKSIAREYGTQDETTGLNIWGGGYDIISNGSGYMQEYLGNTEGNYKTVYSYSDEPDRVIASEKQYATSSPLSFDLNGNGINTSEEMISFDIDGDGILDKIYDSADAVLVFDKDGDGISGEDGSECFGDNTDLDGDGKADGYKDGFEALKALAEMNGLIGENDSQLDKNDLALLEELYGLKIKTNGYMSDAISLSETGISNINLAKTDKTNTDYNFDGKGNELMHQEGATFTIDGEEREYADLWHRKFK